MKLAKGKKACRSGLDVNDGLIICGAEGETRTPTRKPGLDPEPSASTSSATSARTRKIGRSIGFQRLL